MVLLCSAFVLPNVFTLLGRLVNLFPFYQRKVTSAKRKVTSAQRKVTSSQRKVTKKENEKRRSDEFIIFYREMTNETENNEVISTTDHIATTLQLTTIFPIFFRSANASSRSSCMHLFVFIRSEFQLINLPLKNCNRQFVRFVRHSQFLQFLSNGFHLRL